VRNRDPRDSENARQFGALPVPLDLGEKITLCDFNGVQSWVLIQSDRRDANAFSGTLLGKFAMDGRSA
jgi:hypothetical protein